MSLIQRFRPFRPKCKRKVSTFRPNVQIIDRGIKGQDALSRLSEILSIDNAKRKAHASYIWGWCSAFLNLVGLNKGTTPSVVNTDAVPSLPTQRVTYGRPMSIDTSQAGCPESVPILSSRRSAAQSQLIFSSPTTDQIYVWNAQAQWEEDYSRAMAQHHRLEMGSVQESMWGSWQSRFNAFTLRSQAAATLLNDLMQCDFEEQGVIVEEELSSACLDVTGGEEPESWSEGFYPFEW